jgi:hypothetical protein
MHASLSKLKNQEYHTKEKWISGWFAYNFMDDIKQWLNSKQDYDAGATLYLLHGTDANLKRIFREPASPFKKQKLLEALKGMLIKNLKSEIVNLKSKEEAKTNLTVSDRKWPEQKDEVLTALHLQWKPLFAEMMNLTSRIYDIALAGKKDPAMQQEAGRMAHRILDLDDMCDDIYKKRDNYIKNGSLPQDFIPDHPVVDPVKWPVALANATRYIRDYKNKLKKDPANENAAKKIKYYEAEKKYYEDKLKVSV